MAKWATTHSAGGGGSPFPPLGVAASGLSSAAFSNSHSHPHNHSHGHNHGAGAGGASTESSSHGKDASGSSSSQTTGLPPAPTKFDATQAQQRRLQDAYWSDDEEDMDCPLCLEEIDLSDANFKPCPCGYQICRFCWHHIKQNLNGRCPACRRKYSDQTVEFKPMTAEEIKRLTLAKKQKERERKELEAMNRKHLANMRVVQKNLVYVVGLNSRLAKEELIPTLRSNDYFGQYGRISKILISKRTTPSSLVMGTQESAIGVYVTYHRKEDAARAIVAVDGSAQRGPDGKTTVVRASYGTTKYCTTYLRNLPCQNPQCTYLHEPGEEADSFTKEDLSTLRHAAKDTEHKSKIGMSAATTTAAVAAKKPDASASAGISADGSSSEASALPKTASWASGVSTAAQASSPLKLANGIIRDSDLPPLSASRPRKGVAVVTQRERTAAAKSASLSTIADVAIPKGPANPSTPTGPKARPGAASIISTAKMDVVGAPPGLGKGAAAAVGASPARSSTMPAAATSGTGTVRPATPTGPSAAARKLERERKAAEAKKEEEKENVAFVGQADSLPATAVKVASVTPAPPSAPPGLSVLSPPPGLAPPANATPASSASSSGSSESQASSTYQPSMRAQALLDDMRARRGAEAGAGAMTPPVKASPFPDLDWDDALQSFSGGGEFSFNLPGLVSANASSSGPYDISGAFASFAPFGAAAPPGISRVSSFSLMQGARATPPPPPGLGLAASNGSDSEYSYSGSFDPFAPGAGESIHLEPGAEAEDERTASPFRAIDEMRRTLSEERGKAASDDASVDGHTGTGKDGDAPRGSRFGFAKRKESNSSSGVENSPFMTGRNDLVGAGGGGGGGGGGGVIGNARNGDAPGQDPLGLSIARDMSGLLGSDLDTEDERPSGLGQQQQEALQRAQSAQQAHGFGMGYLQTEINSPAAQSSPVHSHQHAATNNAPFGSQHMQQPHHGQQPHQAPSQFGHANGGSGFVSAGTPPPGIGLRGAGGMGGQTHHQLHQQVGPPQQHQLGGPVYDRPNVPSHLQQQQQQQQQQQHNVDPLLAIMAAASAGARFNHTQQAPHQQQMRNGGFGGAQGSDMPFYDPAIVMSRNQQQQQQQQAQQQRANFNSGLGGANNAQGGGAGANGHHFSPFDSHTQQQQQQYS